MHKPTGIRSPKFRTSLDGMLGIRNLSDAFLWYFSVPSSAVSSRQVVTLLPRIWKMPNWVWNLAPAVRIGLWYSDFFVRLPPDVISLQFWWIPSSVMWHRVAIIRTDVSEERIASIIRVTIISRQGTSTAACHLDDGGDMFLRIVCSYKITRRNIPEDGILHSHRPETSIIYIYIYIYLQFCPRRVVGV
jgi:hypothetical protein